MSEWESLALVLAVIYVSECLVWVPNGATAFHSAWRLGSRVAAGGFLSNQRGFLLLSNPLPPLGRVLVCQQWAIHPSPWGVSPNAPDKSRSDSGPIRFWKYEDIRQVDTDERWLRVNGQNFVECASPAICRAMADLLDQVRRSAAANRSGVIQRRLKQTHSAGRVRREVELLRSKTLPLLVCCNALFVFFFSTLYIWIREFSLLPYWQAPLAMLVAFLAVIATLMFTLHRGIHPWNRAQRWTHAIVSAVSPMAAIRAVDWVERDALHRFSPLAVAAVLCGPAEFREMARHCLADLTFRRHPPIDDPAWRRSQAWHRDELRSSVESLLSREGINAKELLTAPPSANANCLSYCPICHAQYTMEMGLCADCGDVELRPLESSGAGS